MKVGLVKCYVPSLSQHLYESQLETKLEMVN